MKIVIVIVMILMSSFLFSQDKPMGLSVNDEAPDFTAVNQTGEIISLKSQLDKNSIVLVFYRGEWCPFCSKELQALEDSLRYIIEKGAIVIAVTPERPENISKTIEKTKASYSILYDEGLNIMNSYKVSFKVDSNTVEKYKTYGIDFDKAHGEVNGASLPIPAVYIINKKGIISYRFFDEDYRNRPSVKELLDNL